MVFGGRSGVSDDVIFEVECFGGRREVCSLCSSRCVNYVQVMGRIDFLVDYSVVILKGVRVCIGSVFRSIVVYVEIGL